ADRRPERAGPARRWTRARTGCGTGCRTPRHRASRVWHVGAGRGDHRADGGPAVLMTNATAADLDAFEAHRPLLVAHAYRMLGDLGLAEDMVQNAWLRWSGRHTEVESPRAYLVTLVTRLCINKLDSARMRREEGRGDRLPEPVDLDEGGIGRVQALEQ